MTILAVDPGPTYSALVSWDGEKIVAVSLLPNDEARRQMRTFCVLDGLRIVAVEMIACYGMPVGKEVFETCLQIGRMQQICENERRPCRLVYRLQVKQHLCHDTRAKDSNIRQALLDRFGPQGNKKAARRSLRHQIAPLGRARRRGLRPRQSD